MEQIIIIMILIGFILIGIAIYLIKKEDAQRQNLNIKIDEAFVSINEALESFEEQTGEFNRTCELIFSEIEEKYQELIYLYSVIEEKQINVSNELQDNNDTIVVEDIETEKKKVDNSFIFKNKNAQEIFKLYDEGMDISDIAKTMSIGKGEVTLVLNIRKA